MEKAIDEVQEDVNLLKENFGIECEASHETYRELKKKVDAFESRLDSMDENIEKNNRDNASTRKELKALTKYMGNIFRFLEQNYKAQQNPDGTITKKGWGK